MPTTSTTLRAEQVQGRIRDLVASIVGKSSKYQSHVRGIKARTSYAWFSLVKQAFIVKSRGGTDDAGVAWPKLTAKYLAYYRAAENGKKGYGRRFGKGEQAALKKAAGLGRGNRYAPGGNKGLLSAAELKEWRRIFARSLAYLRVQMPEEEAKARAAAIAWAKLKAMGAKTKLGVYGSRQVEILRDSGVLFNSLAPGQEDRLAPVNGDQVARDLPGVLAVGTRVDYARFHHFGAGRRNRRLWPDGDKIPVSWRVNLNRETRRGVLFAVQSIMGES